MAWDDELDELMVDTVLISPYLSTTFDHVDSFGTAVAYRCHISAKTEEVLRDTGDVALATHRVVLNVRADIDERDRIEMPTRFKVVNPKIMAVLEFTDEEGPHHTKVLVGPRRGSGA